MLIICVTGMIALVAPPNTYDAMTYHMARVMHWIQNHSVAYYPTHILRQLYLSPGAEYLILQFQILGGSDRMANLVQWFSMVGSVLGISLIAGQLGADLRGQLLSSVVVVTIPTGILQASSTQTDYVSTFWVVCFVYFAFLLTGEARLWQALACGASLGLAILAKATSYVYALPFLIWLVVLVLRKHRARSLVLLAIVACATLLINLPTYVRNDELFANPLGMTSDMEAVRAGQAEKYSNDAFTAAGTLSNVIRNLALNLATPSDAINTRLQTAVVAIHQAMGTSPDDPRTTWPGTQFELMRTSFREDYDGNLLDVFYIALAIAVLFFRRNHSREAIYYCIAVTTAYLLFCFYLKWQPWNTRLMLGLFVLWSPAVGIVLAGLRNHLLRTGLIGLLLLAALPWLLLNRLRPIASEQNIFNMPRTSLYFMNRQGYQKPFESVVNALDARSAGQCKQVGLYLRFDDWEYPLWVLLQRKLGNDVVVESVNVENISRTEYARFPETVPCAVLALDPTLAASLNVQGTPFSRVRFFDNVSVFLPEKSGAQAPGAAVP